MRRGWYSLHLQRSGDWDDGLLNASNGRSIYVIAPMEAKKQAGSEIYWSCPYLNWIVIT